MLNIYFREKDVPEWMQLIKTNDAYFNANTVLTGTDDEARILMNVDNAVYNTPESFIGRDKDIGALYREYLSTGCKTALNILTHKNKCFSVVECGQNAKEEILLLKEGNVLWAWGDYIDLDDDTECCIYSYGREFTKIGEWFDYIREEW